MKKKLFTGVIMGIMLSACQKADELTTERDSRSALTSANETGMFNLLVTLW